ncbi:hypothetical protein FHX75_111296 [Micromonospora palomenae]|uniref:Uncharacterized protein n=1 Tax=Micromonospora palomenae TaxID=1461247 RepID=A0A561WW95_9ACTN|nr:hypothetical protein [Micromonospora palomenae]TWG28145.1 hypothetical protein FHX75_111296 [Micromonospora palomenae]
MTTGTDLDRFRLLGYGLVVGAVDWALIQVAPPFAPRRWLAALLTVGVAFGPVIALMGVSG